MSDRRRTGRPVGRPPTPPDQRLSVLLAGARFEDAELAKLRHQAQRAGLRLSAWCRSVLDGAALTVPELEAPLQETLVRTGHVLNDAVYRLHASPEPVTVDALHSIQAVLIEHQRALRAANDALAAESP